MIGRRIGGKDGWIGWIGWSGGNNRRKELGLDTEMNGIMTKPSHNNEQRGEPTLLPFTRQDKTGIALT